MKVKSEYEQLSQEDLNNKEEESRRYSLTYYSLQAKDVYEEKQLHFD